MLGVALSLVLRGCASHSHGQAWSARCRIEAEMPQQTYRRRQRSDFRTTTSPDGSTHYFVDALEVSKAVFERRQAADSDPRN